MSRCKTIIIQNNNLKKENRKVKNVFPSLNILWCRLMSSLTKTKGMKNQREKILSFFKSGKFKVCFTKPLFNRCINLSLYGFIAFKIVSFVRNISVEQFSSFFGKCFDLFLYSIFVTCEFYVFRNNKKRRDTNLRMDHFVVCSGKIQDIDKHENLTKPITNCNLSFDSFQTKKIRNDLRFCEAR